MKLYMITINTLSGDRALWPYDDGRGEAGVLAYTSESDAVAAIEENTWDDLEPEVVAINTPFEVAR